MSVRCSSSSPREAATRRSRATCASARRRPQPRVEHLHEAAGLRSRAGDRARARGGHGTIDEALSAPPSSEALCLLSATEGAAALRAGACSSRELVAAHSARIERIDPLVNAIVTVTPELALAAADEADRRRARGEDLPPLHGLPIAHKDLQDTAGVRTTYGSRAYRDHVPDVDSLQVERLRRAGAISVGKTNVPEWGAGSHTFNRVFGATRNPWDTTRSAGGSSGGAAVALGLPDGAARRRQRSRRLAAQPGGLERRRSDCGPRRASSRAGPSRRPTCRSRSRARWLAPPAISPCCWV